MVSKLRGLFLPLVFHPHRDFTCSGCRLTGLNPANRSAGKVEDDPSAAEEEEEDKEEEDKKVVDGRKETE
jgi:hypothetical protein